jgi:hypothetical protein
MDMVAKPPYRATHACMNSGGGCGRQFGPLSVEHISMHQSKIEPVAVDAWLFNRSAAVDLSSHMLPCICFPLLYT